MCPSPNRLISNGTAECKTAHRVAVSSSAEETLQPVKKKCWRHLIYARAYIYRFWVSRKHWPPFHWSPLRTRSTDYLRTGPRTPPTDHPQNRIKNKNKDTTYYFSNRSVVSAKFRALRWEKCKLWSLGRVYEPAEEWAEQKWRMKSTQSSTNFEASLNFPGLSYIRIATAKEMAMYNDKLAHETEARSVTFFSA